jgi:hypothetical protein
MQATIMNSLPLVRILSVNSPSKQDPEPICSGSFFSSQKKDVSNLRANQSVFSQAPLDLFFSMRRKFAR